MSKYKLIKEIEIAEFTDHKHAQEVANDHSHNNYSDIVKYSLRTID